MAFEVTCSQCQGRLMVEQAGQVVACPHCGTHLSIPAESDESASSAAAGAVADDSANPASESPGQGEAPAAGVDGAATPEIDAAPAFPALEQETQDEIPVFNPATIDIGDGREPPSAAETGADSPTEETAAGVTDETVPTAPSEPAQPVAVSSDNPFANGGPNFGVGFGTASGSESSFSGGEFQFDQSGTEDVATVDEVAPIVVPQEDNSEAAMTSVESANEPDATNETPDATDLPSEPPSESNAEPEADVATFASTDAAEASEQATSAPEPTTAQAAMPSSNTIPRGKYVLVLSWASAATIAALFLAYLQATSQTSKLESLPDVKPPKRNDEIVYQLIPEDAAMPPGHVLALGESQRYGNLKVSAERVTRGPIQFEHYDPSSNRTREDGPEVLKLWLTFENVSSDQSIAPLDELVFQRDDRDFENVRSNTFLARASQKSKSGTRVMVYDHNTSGDWDLKAQKAGFEIPPGEEIETYIPTTPDGVEQVLGSDEELVWRVHFRKGYSPKNYGVTTVIEVMFSESDIESDSGSAAAPSPETDTGSQKA
jgi:hypothetical protein